MAITKNFTSFKTKFDTISLHQLPPNKSSIFIGLLAALFFLPFLGGLHLFDWDEINFAECAREMIVTAEYGRVYMDFQAFWEKPPLFFWLQAAAMQLWGINEYAARFPNALCGIITLVLLFKIGTKLYDARFGWIWVLSYLGSILPHLYFKSGIIDPWFNLLIFSGLYCFVLFYWKSERISTIIQNTNFLPQNQWVYLVGGGIFIGLAMLTKGPVAFLVISLVLAAYWVGKRFHFFVKPFHYVVFSAIAFATTLLWFGFEIAQNGIWFVEEFIKYQYRLFSTHDAGHKGFLGYHFVVLFFGCFPASIFALRSFFPQEHEQLLQLDFKKWMLLLFWVVLILFSIVQSKIVHYSSLCYFPLTYLAAIHIYYTLQKKSPFKAWMLYLLLFVGLLIGLLVALLPLVGKNIDFIKPLFSQDPFALANLDATVNWTTWESLIGVAWIILIVWSVYLLKYKHRYLAIHLLFIGNALFINLALIFFAPKIEAYSQRAAIEFYKSLENKEVYVHPYGFKTYAHLYYTNKRAELSKDNRGEQWLLNGKVDREVYVVCRINKAKELMTLKQLEKIGEKNGFVFFKRKRLRN